MSIFSISLPDSIRQRVEGLAREDGVLVDSFIATILSQRVAVADADSCVRRRGNRGSAAQLLEILEQAPRVEPEAADSAPNTLGCRLQMCVEKQHSGQGMHALRGKPEWD